MTSKRLQGRVIKYDRRDGFGFIESTAGLVFVHQNSLGGVHIEVGDILEFTIYQAGQGQAAEHIQRVYSSTMS